MNRELIKWCRCSGINNLYSVLRRFPSETLEDYQTQCEVIAKVHHWQAPWAIAKARADRGSPMYTAPESQSIARLVPSPCYAFFFQKFRLHLRRLSYHFEPHMG